MDRGKWRLVVNVHVADDDELALRQVHAGERHEADRAELQSVRDHERREQMLARWIGVSFLLLAALIGGGGFGTGSASAPRSG